MIDPELERILRQWDERRTRNRDIMRCAFQVAYAICAFVGLFVLTLGTYAAIRMWFDA